MKSKRKLSKVLTQLINELFPLNLFLIYSAPKFHYLKIYSEVQKLELHPIYFLKIAVYKDVLKQF